MESLITVRAIVDDDGDVRVVAPGIGWWSEIPAAGSWVGPGSRIGVLTRLNRRHGLVLDRGPAGRVADPPPRLVVAVEHGETLFHIAAQETTDAPDSPGGTARARGRDTEVGEGQLAIRAPTDGVFYARPAPDAPPFVEAGQRIRAGQAVGLVEVMKTFNQILFDGPGVPAEAEVLEVRCGDAAEVCAGQVLIVIGRV
jgi:acetyl-CoA carboxylase biotin carboxyl carrier protein